MVIAPIRFKPEYALFPVEVQRVLKLVINKACEEVLYDALYRQEWVSNVKREHGIISIYIVPYSSATDQELFLAVNMLCNDVVNLQIANDKEKSIVYGEPTNQKR